MIMRLKYAKIIRGHGATLGTQHYLFLGDPILVLMYI